MVIQISELQLLYASCNLNPEGEVSIPNIDRFTADYISKLNNFGRPKTLLFRKWHLKPKKKLKIHVYIHVWEKFFWVGVKYYLQTSKIRLF